MREIEIYTDGGCRKLAEGGYGVYSPDFRKGVRLRYCGYDPKTTNNKQELTAVLRALEFVANSKITDAEVVTIFSDSQYVINTFTIWIWNWLKNDTLKDKANSDIIERIWKLKTRLYYEDWDIRFKKVPGHANCEGNNVADRLVNFAIDNQYTGYCKLKNGILAKSNKND